MVKHTQVIRWKIANELFDCVWPFCGIGAERDKHDSLAVIQWNYWKFWNYKYFTFHKIIANLIVVI